VVAGVLEAGNKTPIGYIPAGSTNDFASSLGLSTDIIGAAKDIVNGEKTFIDIGSFNGRKFSYVASFGAFTQSSYATPQSVKNMLGHLAYVLDGVTSIASIKKEHISVEADGQIYEDDYIFGAISNSTSLAGIITLKPEYVDMNDGMFELLLVKSPKNIIEMTEIVNMLMTQNYESNMLTFINAKEFKIHAGKDMPWSLDGEFQEGSEEILVENLHSAIEVFIHKGME
jgi:diacylglycerol kinase (ATP)